MWHRNQSKANKYKAMRKMYKEYVFPLGIYRYGLDAHKSFFEKKEIKPYIYGYRQMLTPIPAISNKEEGLKEAVECASDYIQFSTNEKRYCEIQRSWLQDNGRYGHLGDRSDFIRQHYFHKNGTYKKGLLLLHKISQSEYDSLSDSAKRWFDREVLNSFVRHGRKYDVFVYNPAGRISQSMLMEIQRKIYVRESYIPISEKFKRNAYLEDYLYGSRYKGVKVVHEFFPHERIVYSKCKKYRKGRNKEKQAAYRQMLDEADIQAMSTTKRMQHDETSGRFGL